MQVQRTTALRSALAHPSALEHTLVAVAAAAWLLRLTPKSGGLFNTSTAFAAVAMVPALIVTRPWRRVPLVVIAATGLAAAGALLVLMTTPSGWQQADSPAAQLLGMLALVLTAAYCRTAARRTAVAAVLLAAIGLQFLPAWNAWRGASDPNHIMVGTFYWHNQLGIWMTATGLVATTLAVAGFGRLRVAACVLAPLANVCVLLSTSRASIGLLLLGQLAVLALVPGCGRRFWALLRWGGTVAATAALLVFLTSPLFFDQPWNGLTAAKESAGNPVDRGGDSLASNGASRGRLTVAALEGWFDKPIAGEGFGSFANTQAAHLPAGSQYSAFVHNGYAEALTSGGLLFGGPVLVLAMFLGVAAVRAFVGALSGGRPERAVLGGSAIACGSLLIHSGLDFDWHYPSLVVLLGVVGGLILRKSSVEARGIPVVGTLLAVVSVVVAGSLVEHHGRQALSTGGSAERLLKAQPPFIHDPRLEYAALKACVEDGRLVVPSDTARRAVVRSERAAALDPEIARLRAEVERLLR